MRKQPNINVAQMAHLPPEMCYTVFKDGAAFRRAFCFLLHNPMPRSSASLKSQGELAESAFLHQATARGLVVSKPWGETSAYDFIVDAAGQLFRVQVRSVSVARRRAYRICCTKGRSTKVPLTPRDIDLLAAYIFPLDLWYLIPVRAFSPVQGIRLRPGGRGRFERFCNAWSLLGAPGR